MRVDELMEATNTLHASMRSHDQQLQRSGKLEQALEELSNQIKEGERNAAELWSTLDGYGIPKLNDSIKQLQNQVNSVAKSLELMAASSDGVANDVGILQRRLQEEQQVRIGQLKALQDKVSHHETTRSSQC